MRLQLPQFLPLGLRGLLEVETPEDGDNLVDGVRLVEGVARHLDGRTSGRCESTLSLVDCSLGTGGATHRPTTLGTPEGERERERE